jgi:hypothetical protein
MSHTCAGRDCWICKALKEDLLCAKARVSRCEANIAAHLADPLADDPSCKHCLTCAHRLHGTDGHCCDDNKYDLECQCSRCREDGFRNWKVVEVER